MKVPNGDCLSLCQCHPPYYFFFNDWHNSRVFDSLFLQKSHLIKHHSRMSHLQVLNDGCFAGPCPLLALKNNFTVKAVRQRLYSSMTVHLQMVNNEIRLIIFFVAKDGEALYNQQKQDRELNVAQIMNPLLPNSDLN